MLDSLIWMLLGAGVGGLVRIFQWLNSAPLPMIGPISLPPARRPREIIMVAKGFEFDRPL